MIAIIDGFCEPFRILRRLWLALTAPKPQRVALKLVSYADADQYLKEGWKIAKEEDANRQYGFVYLERLQVQSTGEQPK